MTKSNNIIHALNVRVDVDKMVRVEKRKITIKEYLADILCALWEKEDAFNPKRPLGESDWKATILLPLAEAGFINYTMLQNGYTEIEDMKSANEFVIKLIKSLGMDIESDPNIAMSIPLKSEHDAMVYIRAPVC